MKSRTFFLLLSILCLIPSGCSGMKDFPLFPLDVKIQSDRNSQVNQDSDSIQRFMVEGFTVIFDKKQMRITIIPDSSTRK